MTKVHFFNKGTYFFKQSYIYTKGKFWGKSPAGASISKLTKRPHLLFDRHDWSYLSVIWKECCPVHPWERSIWALLHHRFSRKIHHQRIPFKSLLTSTYEWPHKNYQTSHDLFSCDINRAVSFAAVLAGRSCIWGWNHQAGERLPCRCRCFHGLDVFSLMLLMRTMDL